MRALIAVLAVLVTLAAVAVPAHASFPGRNGGIAFAEHSSSGDFDPQLTQHAGIVLALRPFGEGGRTRTLVDCERTDGVPTGGNCAGTDYRSPSYSSDGKWIVFDTGARLAVMDANGGNFTLLPAATTDDGQPSFSPDGQQIVFTGASDHGGTDLYRRRLDGGQARLIINDADEPAWSRHGIAYVRGGNVYTANPNGGRRRWVTSGVSPDWSPDARRLVLVRPLPRLTFDLPIGRIYTVSPNGRNVRHVRGVNDASHPVWSPDGRWLAYARFDAGVFAKRLGSRQEPVIVKESQFSGENGSHSAFDPAWRPIPTATPRGRSQPGL
jgi:Tol biopolymer transport system component